MSPIFVLISMIQINNAPLSESHYRSLIAIPTLQVVSLDMDYLSEKTGLYGLNDSSKTDWLKSIVSEQNKMKEVNIISEWIVPVTVTAGVGSLVYAVYRFRGR